MLIVSQSGKHDPPSHTLDPRNFMIAKLKWNYCAEWVCCAFSQVRASAEEIRISNGAIKRDHFRGRQRSRLVPRNNIIMIIPQKVWGVGGDQFKCNSNLLTILVMDGAPLLASWLHTTTQRAYIDDNFWWQLNKVENDDSTPWRLAKVASSPHLWCSEMYIKYQIMIAINIEEKRSLVWSSQEIFHHPFCHSIILLYVEILWQHDHLNCKYLFMRQSAETINRWGRSKSITEKRISLRCFQLYLATQKWFLRLNESSSTFSSLIVTSVGGSHSIRVLFLDLSLLRLSNSLSHDNGMTQIGRSRLMITIWSCGLPDQWPPSDQHHSFVGPQL